MTETESRCANGADGTSNIEGKVTREGASERGQRTSFNILTKIGRRGGLASRRELTRSHAKKMVAIREAKRAAIKAGRPWPTRNHNLLTLS